MTATTNENIGATARFTLISRILHWTMAPMVIVQLLIGVTMIASLSYYPLLLAIHRPLGLAILVFAVVRLANRLSHRPPAFLATMSRLERRIATWSEYALYALLLAQPVVGWAMLSAARFPVVVVGHFASDTSPEFLSNSILIKHSSTYIAQYPNRVKVTATGSDC